ncbi:MAG: hypothetical protein AABY32_02130 [Nanoarchaeota archaeon]
MSCSKHLNKFPNDIFIETGSLVGKGIKNALKYGFKEIHSIEILKTNYDICVKLFKDDKRVNLYLGDSAETLPYVLKNIKNKVTFLLDAHGPCFKCPILKELKIILDHSNLIGVKHTIIIDDAKYFNGKREDFGFLNIADVKEIVNKYPLYIFNNNKKYITIL